MLVNLVTNGLVMRGHIARTRTTLYDVVSTESDIEVARRAVEGSADPVFIDYVNGEVADMLDEIAAIRANFN